DNFWRGSDPMSADHSFFRQLFVRGANFVCAADLSQMAPSRFAGYATNTLARHRRAARINGGTTDAAITRVLGERSTHGAADRAYRRLCGSFGLEPARRERRYWVLPAAPVDVPGASSAPDPPG